MSFDFNRLRRSDWITGGGAVALFVIMFFFSWYGVSSNVGTGVTGVSGVSGLNINGSATGWEAFTNSRWIWLITIIVAIGAVLLTAVQRELEGPIPAAAIVTGLGALSSILILYRIVHHPSASASLGSFHISAGIKFGIWLALVAALAITYGGYLMMQDEGASSEAIGPIGAAPATDAAPAATPPIPPPPPVTESPPIPPSPPATASPPVPQPAAPPSESLPIPPPATPPEQGGEGT